MRLFLLSNDSWNVQRNTVSLQTIFAIFSVDILLFISCLCKLTVLFLAFFFSYVTFYGINKRQISFIFQTCQVQNWFVPLVWCATQDSRLFLFCSFCLHYISKVVTSQLLPENREKTWNDLNVPWLKIVHEMIHHAHLNTRKVLAPVRPNGKSLSKHLSGSAIFSPSPHQPVHKHSSLQRWPTV